MVDLLNTKFDAIVIGSGITGGWAAKELCEQGLKVLVLERGRMVEHPIDYPTAHLASWQLPFGNLPDQHSFTQQAKQSRSGFATNQDIKHWFVNDIQHPYQENKRFDWLRGYHVGGRSLIWGRQCLRLSDLDFNANAIDNHGVDWPIRYNDLAPWYDKVEQFIGVMGEPLNLSQLPDGKFLPAMPLNSVEKDLRASINKHYQDRYLTIGRVAHLTVNKNFEGRSQCTYRNKCMRGCPTGSYFSSNASTLPAAKKTGNMTLRPHSIVSKINYNERTKLATGVEVIDTNSHKKFTIAANIIFCCASTVATTSLLMQSTCRRFPHGLGNDSGQLGHNLMDHHFRIGATATVSKFDHLVDQGKRPVGFHIPRFRNLVPSKKSDRNFIRGYGYQGYATRSDWRRGIKEMSFGADFKEQLFNPGSWQVALIGFGECLPQYENKLSLDYSKLDPWGLPTVTFDCQYGDNEINMREDMKTQAVGMLSTAGYENVQAYDDGSFPGQAIHEMGTARMGKDPTTSVVNKHNQLHSVANVYVTDGSFMASSGYQNPSLTYMAFTARAAAHAVKQFKQGLF
ncbi:GMC oxidoreductase [Thalassotalea sp. PP2-459]|uniref:GMC oxidoreductase n=1 Tax=Thalassotalea sp. PP2-459 TaxID=1742724 RepID=UPI0009433F99|nr:GMC family oxidoreductase [Thalassotalea sp. PP2-459]OKY26214.1 GMC family oxidoreductase [Thalassotalea sp. PP2-459]